MSKTFNIITFGCRTNQAESRVIGEQLCRQGWKQTDNKPDLVILNSCSVTTKAEREIRKEIRRLKRENPKCFLVVCGCWIDKLKSQNSKLKVATQNSKLLENIDLIASNKDKKKLPELIDNNLYKSYKNYKSYSDKYLRSGKAIVKIQDGCDNFCTYCIVPYLRGRSRSKPAAQVIEEINQLVNMGTEEVILTGIDIASYKPSLSSLLKTILLNTKIKKISFGSINLEAFSEEFIDLLSWHKALRSPRSNLCVFNSLRVGSKATRQRNFDIASRIRLANDKKSTNGSMRRSHYRSSQNLSASSPSYFRLTTHFHIPLQSGCDQTLRRMKRKYTSAEFLKKIRQLKKTIPDFSFSTDIIVGFPGETEKEFKESLRSLKGLKSLMRKNFTKIHVFRYSSRPGTLAYKMEGKIGWERTDEREKKKCAKAVVEIMKR